MEKDTIAIDFTDRCQVAGAIQYTNVNPDLTREGALAHLQTCVDYGFNAAMIGPCWASLAVEVLRGTGVRVATTLNFPQANDTLAMKVTALRELTRTGAQEFDFPPKLLWRAVCQAPTPDARGRAGIVSVGGRRAGLVRDARSDSYTRFNCRRTGFRRESPLSKIERGHGGCSCLDRGCSRACARSRRSSTDVA